MKKLGKGCLIVVGVVLILGIIGAVLGSGSRSPSGSAPQPTAAAINAIAQPVGDSVTSTAPAAAAPEATAAPTTYAVGEDVRVDEVRWKVIEAVDLGKILKADNEFVKDKTTAGRFVKLRFELENLSKDMLTFAGLDLVDDQNRTFKASSDTFQFIPTDEACVLENLNPNVAKSCTAIYEVPANAAGIQAQVGDLKLLGDMSALIDLGLKGK